MPKLTEIEKAKEVIKQAEKVNIDLCLEIHKKASEEIAALGFQFIPKGEFIGNQISVSMVLVKNK